MLNTAECGGVGSALPNRRRAAVSIRPDGRILEIFVHNKLATFLKVRRNQSENRKSTSRRWRRITRSTRPNSERPQVEGVHDSFQDQRTDEFLTPSFASCCFSAVLLVHAYQLILPCPVGNQGTTHNRKKASPRTPHKTHSSPLLYRIRIINIHSAHYYSSLTSAAVT